MKRVFSFILAVVLLVSCVPSLGLSAHALPTSGSAGKNITWKMHDDGTLVFSGRGAMDDNKQHFVKDWVSYYWQDITSVVFEEGITYIGAWSFYQSRTLPRLRSVTIPSTVTKIGEYAFNCVGNINEVHISSLEKWLKIEFCGNAANPLENNAALYLKGELVEHLVIPKSVTKIQDMAFFGCTSIKTLEIPSSVRSIGSFAFNSNYNLSKVIFYGNAPAIGEHIFTNVSANAYYPKNNSTWTETTRSNFGGTIRWKTYDPNTDKVASDAFPGGKPVGYADWDMNEKTGVLRIYGTGDMANYSNAGGPWRDAYQYQIKRVVVEDGVTRIGDYAFLDLNNLSSVTLPQSLKSIGGYSFCRCPSLTKVTIPSEVERLGEQIFDPSQPMTIEFTGSAPRVMGSTYFSTRTSVYYPAEDPSWTLQVMQNFSGKTTWIAVGAVAPSAEDVTRIFGANRYETAIKTANELKAWLDVPKFDCIIVASGATFPDALAASCLASEKKAPILLASQGNTKDLKAYIKMNLNPGGTVYLLGGENAVPATMEMGMEEYKVIRLGGTTRYDTNLQILRETAAEGKDLIVCTGTNYADSLSASATALPVLLVQKKLTGDQKAFLETITGDIIIIGGTNAVGTGVESELSTYGNVRRIAGNTRYDTTVMVAEEFFEKPDMAVLAYAQNFPDGLCAGPLAYVLNAPLILTATNKGTQAIRYTVNRDIRAGYILGGISLINDYTARQIFSRDAYYPIIAK